MTPVLCDQLEAMRGEPGERYMRFLREVRAPIHAEDAAGLEGGGEHRLAAEVRRAASDYTRAERAFEERGRDLDRRLPLTRARGALDLRGHARAASADRDGRRPAAPARHGDGLAHAAVRPLVRWLLAAGVRVRARARARAGGRGRAGVLRGPDRGGGLRPPPAGRHRAGAGGRADRLGDGPARLERRRTATRRIRSTGTTGAARFTTCVRGATRASPTTTRRRWRSRASTPATS